MRVLFWTDADRIKSPSARQWFYQMHELVAEKGIKTSLNTFHYEEYDIVVIHLPQKYTIQNILAHSPNAHVGILNPGYLGFPTKYIKSFHQRRAWAQQIVSNVDFFLVTTFLWRELLLPYQRRVYQIIDYDTPEDKPLKQHVKSENLTIGYHGNELHYAKDFFPHGANALKRLAQEHDFTLKIITSNVLAQPQIEGVRTELVEFDLDTFSQQVASFDVGICPAFSNMAQLSDPFMYIRNSNRVHTLLFYGIPSVASPLPQACQDLTHNETVLFAVNEEGWYQSIKRLITQPTLRNKIGHAGRELVTRHFSAEVACQIFINLFHEELSYKLFPKAGFSSILFEKQLEQLSYLRSMPSRIQRRVKMLKAQRHNENSI